jgi:ADP-ribose pyrophosphatase
VDAETDAWKILESEIVIQTRHLRLRRDTIELPTGELVRDYFVRESRGFSIVFALTPGERVVLVRQYKHGIGESLLELPAGAIDPGETPSACAQRELAEETGYAGNPAEPEHLGSFVYDPTSSNTRYHLFLVRDCEPAGEQKLDPTEQISVELASLAELRSFVRDGRIEVGAHVASIYYTLDRLGKL